MRTPAPEHKQAPRLQQRIDLVLTALFLVTIFVFGTMTVASDVEGLHTAFGSRTRLRNYLDNPFNYSAWDFFAARIKSVDAYLASNAWHATELGYMNYSLQYALGKRLLSTGGQQMLKLNTGHLYDLQAYVSMDTAANDIKTIRELCGDIPYIYAYEHPTLYDEALQMPSEYACLDHSAEMADEIMAALASENIDAIDSRAVLTTSGIPMNEYLMITDQHWTTRAAIEMTRVIADRVSAATGVQLDTSRIAMDQLESRTYEKLFLGKYGQRIGVINVDPDDITIFWPKYDTNIHRFTQKNKESFDLNGPFYDSVIRHQYLEPDEGKTWNISAYTDYGLTENYDIYDNPDGADITVLLLKDSYSAPIGSFLSLMAKHVVAYDLRKGTDTLAQLLETYKPDCVVQAYSLQMLKQDLYEFQ